MAPLAFTVLVAWGVLAFGAVYAWGSVSLACAVVGFGVWQCRLRRLSLELALPCALLLAALGGQLLPLAPALLSRVTPSAVEFLLQFDVAFANGATQWHALSIDPRLTLRAAGYTVLWMLWIATCVSMLARMPIRGLARNITVVATGVALLGLAQKATFNGKLLWFWTPEYYATNGFGPFVNRNHFAGWMVLAVGLSSGLLVGSVRRSRLVSLRSWRERVLWFGSPSASPVLLTAAATLAMACSLMWTMSRSGIIAAGVLVCVLTVAATRASAGRVQRAFIAGCVLCAAVSVIAWRGADTLLNWYGNTTTLGYRVQLWRDTLPALRDYWVTGSGVNTYASLMVLRPRSEMSVQPLQAHNDYLQLAVEGGLLVGIPALFLVLAVGRRVWRTLRAPQDEMTWWIRVGAVAGVCGIAVQEISEFSLQIPGVALLFGFCLAVAMHEPADSVAQQHPRPADVTRTEARAA